MKQWYMILIGYDMGDVESGPIFRTEYEAVKARSLKKAKERAKKLVNSNYPEGCEGYSVHLANDEDMNMIHKMMEQTAELTNWEKNLIFDNGNVYVIDV